MNSEEILKQIEDIYQKAAREGVNCQTDQDWAKFRKAMDVAKAVLDTADAIMKIIPEAYPKKKFRHYKGRLHRLRRSKRNDSKMEMYLISRVGRMQSMIIESQPIPKFWPDGGISHGHAQIGGFQDCKIGQTYHPIKPEILDLPRKTIIIPDNAKFNIIQVGGRGVGKTFKNKQLLEEINKYSYPKPENNQP